MIMTGILTSAAGYIQQLDEPQNEIKYLALYQLNNIVDEFWPEMADAITKIEIQHGDQSLPQEHRQLAALVASKILFHLGDLDGSLTLALGAGPLFDLSHRSEYMKTVTSKCIDRYIQTVVITGPALVDHRLVSILNQLLENCFEHKQYKQAIGIALEIRDMAVFSEIMRQSENDPELLAYAFRIAVKLIAQRSFRDAILRTLVDFYMQLDNPDYVNICQCLILLDNSFETAGLLFDLLNSPDEHNKLMSFQMGFDLYESATQNFLGRVLEALNELKNLRLAAMSNELQIHWAQLVLIINGGMSIALHLEFLVRSNKADLAILRRTRAAVRVTTDHTGTIIANAFMHSGTTSDQFLREDLRWLAQAANWAKFLAVASLGVIHQGHEKDAVNLMRPYLPREGGRSTAGYSEGGALFALGLIHANHGAGIIEYLLDQLTSATNENIVHGGCIGVGLAAMASARQDIYDAISAKLHQDDAVIGEAAGIAMGLVMLGSMSDSVINDLVSYAQETQHEKILRGLALGISFVVFGRLEAADALIERLLNDKDPLLRRAGVFSVAMAYCGTAGNSAIQRLLKVAVSDVNDDVRRASVIGLGFLLSRAPEQCPSVVLLLAESYNPHVRYGAALAIGIAYAGSGNKEAIAIIQPLITDSDNYVRQGALLASAMLLIQQTEVICPKVKEFRNLYSKILTDRHEDVMARFGAILAQGIIDAGGRNATVNLSSRAGHVWLQGAVGMLLFTHYWYWFPMSLCLGIAFTPTCIIAVNKNLQIPSLEFKSNAKPSTFAYPSQLDVDKKVEKKRVATAILSVTAKAQRRESEKMKASGVKIEEMETEDEGIKRMRMEVKIEPAFEMLANPARVMQQQTRFIELNSVRWKPVKDISNGGIVVVRDLNPSQPLEFVNLTCSQIQSELEPPEAFNFNDELEL